MLPVAPSAFARRVLWHPFSLDTTRLTKSSIHEPHEKPGVHLFWVLSGHGTLAMQGESYDLMPGNCIWLANMTERRVYSPQAGEHIVKQGFRFGGPAVEAWHKELGGTKKARFFLKDTESMRHEYQTMWQLCRRKPTRWEWQVHLIIGNMLGLLADSRNLLTNTAHEIPTPVVRVLDALAKAPFSDLKVKDLVALSGASYSKLRDLFFQTEGKSLHEFIQQGRLDQASMLLADEKMSIKQIAEQLNFSSEFYFSHFFKRLSGQSPTAFRAMRSKKK